MFVKKIRSDKGIKEVGGNIFTVKCKNILDDSKIVTNSRNYHKNLY